LTIGEEIFDVVDDQDRIIGQDTRSRIHRLKLKHRAVHVLVFNSRGDLFLQKRSLNKDSSPGLWDSSAAGHLDKGEGYDKCAMRELEEELGLRVMQPPERLLKLDACEDTGHEFVWVYRLNHDGPFKLNPEELETGAWYAPAVVNIWMQERPAELSTTLRLIWKERDYLLP
jgi:isopentenyldiphosphate isomerase